MRLQGMRDSKQHRRVAVEAVARRFSATWEASRDSAEPSITVGGKRIALAVVTLERQGRRNASVATLRLRFDKVATRLLERLRATLGELVPGGTTVLLTVTAPIRSWSKTALAVEAKVRTILARRSSRRVKAERIEGNLVHIQALEGEVARSPQMIGFVHNPESDALMLLSMAREALESRSARAGRRVGARWLVVVSGGGRSVLDAYRSICSQVGLETDFQKILVVLGDGHVEVLTGQDYVKDSMTYGGRSRGSGRPWTEHRLREP
jgi:hypothetical protein